MVSKFKILPFIFILPNNPDVPTYLQYSPLPNRAPLAHPQPSYPLTYLLAYSLTHSHTHWLTYPLTHLHTLRLSYDHIKQTPSLMYVDMSFQCSLLPWRTYYVKCFGQSCKKRAFPLILYFTNESKTILFFNVWF